MARLPLPVGVAVTIVIGGCSDGASSTRSADGGLLRVHQGGGQGGLHAVVGGTVEADLDAGCVWVGDPDGSRYPVVWPRGTTASKDPFEVRLPDGTRVVPGDRVSGGGGYVDASGDDWEPFPAECVQTGTAAVFNPDAEVTVEPDAGKAEAGTLHKRFQVPEAIGLTLVAVAPAEHSVATIDMVTGTVHVYGSDDYEDPRDAIDGATGGGGFIHLWSDGTVYSYAGFAADPVVYEPQELRREPGIVSALTVVTAPDGERTWLVQPGTDSAPTTAELVDLVEDRVTRLATVEVDGEFRPAGLTSGGVVMVSGDRSARTVLVTAEGPVAGVDGAPLAVGWSGAAILRLDGALQLVDPLLRPDTVVPPPDSGEWVSVARPGIPTSSPPSVTGTAASGSGGAFVVGQRAGDSKKTTLVLVSGDGDTLPLFDTGGSPFVTWSRDGRWIAVAERGNVTLVSVEEGDAVSLGQLVPERFYVLTGA